MAGRQKGANGLGDAQPDGFKLFTALMERLSEHERRAHEFKKEAVEIGQVRKEAQQYVRDLCEGVKREVMD